MSWVRVLLFPRDSKVPPSSSEILSCFQAVPLRLRNPSSCRAGKRTGRLCHSIDIIITIIPSGWIVIIVATGQALVVVVVVVVKTRLDERTKRGTKVAALGGNFAPRFGRMRQNITPVDPHRVSRDLYSRSHKNLAMGASIFSLFFLAFLTLHENYQRTHNQPPIPPSSTGLRRFGGSYWRTRVKFHWTLMAS